MKQTIHNNNPFSNIEENTYIFFDADDTLWEDQIYYKQVEKGWINIMSEYGNEKYLHNELYKIEIKNMPTMGYGTKAYCLSLIETALKLSNNNISGENIRKIYEMGTNLLNISTTPFEGVKETLELLSKKFKLICLTKGDLLDQENKLKKSGLEQYFQHLEIVSEKNEQTYLNLSKKYKVEPQNFIMVGNLFKSDIDPVLKIGGWGIYIPCKNMWAYEQLPEYQHEKLISLKNMKYILNLINQ